MRCHNTVFKTASLRNVAMQQSLKKCLSRGIAMSTNFRTLALGLTSVIVASVSTQALAASADAAATAGEAAAADAGAGLNDIIVTAEKAARDPAEDRNLDLGPQNRRSREPPRPVAARSRRWRNTVSAGRALFLTAIGADHQRARNRRVVRQQPAGARPGCRRLYRWGLSRPRSGTGHGHL